MMGRSPSHITLECANLTQPNVALIGEEIEARRMTLAEVVGELADAVELRASEGKYYGVVLIPEGLVEHPGAQRPAARDLDGAARREERGGRARGGQARRRRGREGRRASRGGAPPALHPQNTMGAGLVGRAAPGGAGGDGAPPPTSGAGRRPSGSSMVRLLSNWAQALLSSMPGAIQHQLLLETNSSDDKAQLSQIETERLLMRLVQRECERRAAAGDAAAAKAKFSGVPFYLGYQARSSMPSTFDCDLGYTLGATAAALACVPGATGYMATAHCLSGDAAQWRVCGTPLYSLMSAEVRAGGAVAVIRPSSVDLSSPSFQRLAAIRPKLAAHDLYRNPGPLQFDGGLAELVSPRREGHAAHARLLAEFGDVVRDLTARNWPGASPHTLETSLTMLRALQKNLDVLAFKEASKTTRPVASHVRATHLTREQVMLRDN